MEPAFKASVINQCQVLPSLGNNEVLGLTRQGRVVICSEDSAADEDTESKALMMTFVNANRQPCEWLKVRKRDVSAIETSGPVVSKPTDSVSLVGSGKESDEQMGAVGGHPEATEYSVVTNIPDGMYIQGSNDGSVCEEHFDINNDELYWYIRSSNGAWEAYDFVSYIEKRMEGIARETADGLADIINNTIKELLDKCKEGEQQSVKSECYKAIFNSFCDWIPVTDLRFKLDDTCRLYHAIKNTFATLTVPESSSDELDPVASASANDFTANSGILSAVREKYEWLENIDNLLPSDEYLQNVSDSQFGQDPSEIRDLLEAFVKSSLYSCLPSDITEQVRDVNGLEHDVVDKIVKEIIVASLSPGFFDIRYNDHSESDEMIGLGEFFGASTVVHMEVRDGRIIFLVRSSDD